MLTLAGFGRITVTAITLAVATPGLAAQGTSVSGTVTVLDPGDRAARDVGDAVVWLERVGGELPRPDSFTVFTEDKQFRPRISVVTVGSLIAFPNNDPFNHNVFSLSEEATFDLGLYGRRRSRSARFDRPGVVNVYCNVHSTMSAMVVVLPTGLHTRPGADGTFTIDHVPPGRYALKVWHERASDIASRDLTVSRRAVAGLAFELDARQFRVVEHTNKYGRPYRSAGRRY